MQRYAQLWSTLALLLVCGGAPLQAQSVLVATGSVWKYLDTGVDQSSNWILPGFGDGSWQQGAAPLGFGDSGMGTIVQGGPQDNRTTTIYFRRPFFFSDPAILTNLLLRVRRDDGVVVYLNGTEIWRSNMPQGPVSFLTLSSGFVVGGLEETTFFQTEITSALSLLSAGSNWLAVEVHQFDPHSSDLVFDLELRGNSAVTNLPPTMLLSPYPKHRALYPTGSDIGFEVDAAYVFDPDGSVTNVEFYANGVLVAQTTGMAIPPSNRDIKFTAAWHDASNGTYALTAVAYDNQGVWTASANIVSINVTSVPTPVVVITNPTPGTLVSEGASLTIYTSTTDPAAITRVQFFSDGSLLGTVETAPYRMTVSNLSVGPHELSAVVVANGGSVASYTPVPIVVVPRLGIQRYTSNVVLTWHGEGFQLEAAPVVEGIYYEVPGATSPSTNSASEARQFYRLRLRNP